MRQKYNELISSQSSSCPTQGSINNNASLSLDTGEGYQYDEKIHYHSGHSFLCHSGPRAGIQWGANLMPKALGFITAVCMTLMVSTIALAEDTTTETCANGAGTVVIGAVTGHKYCKGTSKMNWWNAMAWCDGQGRRLFDLSDCACSNTISDCSRCVELKDLSVGAIGWIWTNTSSTINPKETNAHEKMVIIMSNQSQTENGHFNHNGPRKYTGAAPLCK